jgi:ribosome biogenesis protein ERB1
VNETVSREKRKKAAFSLVLCASAEPEPFAAIAMSSKRTRERAVVAAKSSTSSAASSRKVLTQHATAASSSRHSTAVGKQRVVQTDNDDNDDDDDDDDDDDNEVEVEVDDEAQKNVGRDRLIDDDDDDDDMNGDDADDEEDDGDERDAELSGDDEDEDEDDEDESDDGLLDALALGEDDDDDDDDKDGEGKATSAAQQAGVKLPDGTVLVDDVADGDDGGDGGGFKELTPEQMMAQLRIDALDPRIRYLARGPTSAEMNEKEQAYADGADFYESESDEELDGDTNTVGNVPMEWYRHYDHIGYNVFGQRLMKAEEGDRLDRFLSRADDPAYWRTVRDEVNARDVTLSERELDLIRAMQRNRFPTGYDPYEWPAEQDDPALKIHGFKGGFVEPKSRFLPSKYERAKIRRIVWQMQKGKIAELRPGYDPNPKQKLYDLWGESDEAIRRAPHLQLKAPGMRLPGHAESYRPPEEYLFTPEERKRWEALDEEDRHISVMPQRFDSLRQVPLFAQGLKERFERCLDLYLCPRTARKRSHRKTPLLPKLPKPADLRPFPTTIGVSFVGHTSRVRSMSVHGNGQWLATAGDDRSVRVWEVMTGRCLKVLVYPNVVMQVQWCPNVALTLLAVVCDEELYFVNAGVGAATHNTATELMLKLPAQRSKGAAQWLATPAIRHGGITVKHSNVIKQVAWHHKGDYCATVAPGGGSMVLVHQLTTARSQAPFRKTHGRVECVRFHPTKPLFVVATQLHVRIYHLVQQKLIKKLKPNVKYISNVDVHPRGENLLVTSYDRKLAWFDLELSTSPFKTLRYHTQAIRRARFHPRLPLFASASDDASVHVFHGMVYDDWNRDALIVPLKVLRGHKTTADGLGVLDIEWHPTQPWLFSCGGDKTVHLWS